MRASPPRSTRVCCRVITGYRSQTVNPKQTENYTYFPAVKGRCWIARRDAQHQLLDRAMRHGALSQLIGLRPLAPGRFTNSGVQEAPGSVCAESPLGSRVSILTLTLFERSPLLSQSRPLSKFAHTQDKPNYHMLMMVSLRSGSLCPPYWPTMLTPPTLHICPRVQEYLRKVHSDDSKRQCRSNPSNDEENLDGGHARSCG
jgi:hypothetical protein